MSNVVPLLASTVGTDEWIDELHRRCATGYVRIEDHAVRETEPAVLDGTALTIDYDEPVLAPPTVNDKPNRTCQLMAAQLVSPRVRYLSDAVLYLTE